MVYCTRCGTLNADDATVCKNCGAPLQGSQAQSQAQTQQPHGGPYYRHWQWEDYREYHRQSGAFAALAIGMLIILIGISVLFAAVYGVNIVGAVVLLYIGLLIIIAGIRARSHWRRH